MFFECFTRFLDTRCASFIVFHNWSHSSDDIAWAATAKRAAASAYNRVSVANCAANRRPTSQSLGFVVVLGDGMFDGPSR